MVAALGAATSFLVCSEIGTKTKSPEQPYAVQGFKSLVPKKGLEPPHPCEYMDLNHARLPIPPLRHGYQQIPWKFLVREFTFSPAGCWTAAVASLAKGAGNVKPCSYQEARTGRRLLPVDCTHTVHQEEGSTE